jgi:hypothetical protein
VHDDPCATPTLNRAAIRAARLVSKLSQAVVTKRAS